MLNIKFNTAATNILLATGYFIMRTNWRNSAQGDDRFRLYFITMSTYRSRLELALVQVKKRQRAGRYYHKPI